MPAVLKGALWAGKHVLGVWEGCLQHVLCRYYRWGGRAVCKGGMQPAASPGPPHSSPPLSLPSLRGHHWIRNCFATGIGEAIKRASWDTISALKDGKTTSGKQVWEPRERFLPSCILWGGRNTFLNSFEFSSLVFGLSPIPSQAVLWQNKRTPRHRYPAQILLTSGPTWANTGRGKVTVVTPEAFPNWPWGVCSSEPKPLARPRCSAGSTAFLTGSAPKTLKPNQSKLRSEKGKRSRLGTEVNCPSVATSCFTQM